MALGIFISAIGCVALGFLPVQIAFVSAAVLMVLVKLISPKVAY
jgi:hypothetical protein